VTDASPGRSPGPARLLARAAVLVRRPSVVGGAFVALVALVRVLPVTVVEDLGFNDDAAYLRLGVRMRLEPVPGAAGPLFAAWYWMTSHVFDSRVQTQLATRVVLGAAVGLVVYVLARALGARRGPAVLAALALTATALPVVRPTVGTFAAVVLWTTVAVAWRWRGRPRFWPILTVGVALTTWTRPEFLVALVGVVGFAALAGLVGPGARERRRSLLAVGACLLVVAAGWAVAGSPVAGGRQWVAFCQHEAYARSTLDDDRAGSPWLGWRQVCAETYGSDTTIGAAVLHHPGAVAAHVGRSLRLLPGSIRDALTQERGVVARVRNWAGALAGAALVAAAVVVVTRRRRRLGPGCGRRACRGSRSGCCSSRTSWRWW